jgi:hypothetical protein
MEPITFIFNIVRPKIIINPLYIIFIFINKMRKGQSKHIKKEIMKSIYNHKNPNKKYVNIFVNLFMDCENK